MSIASFRAVLDAVLALFRADARRAAQTLTPAPGAGGTAEERAAAASAAEHAYRTLMLGAVQDGRHRAWAAAALYLQEQASAQADASSFIPPPPVYDPSLLSDAARTAPGPLASAATRSRLEDALDRHVEMAARQTVTAAVDTSLDEDAPQDEELTASERRALEAKARAQADRDTQDAQEQADLLAQADKTLTDAGIPHDSPDVKDKGGRRILRPFAWARVLTPSSGKAPCGFCVVCAARGPVYSSKEAALTRDGSRTTRYHDRCRCLAVPVYSSRSWPGKDDYERLAKTYQETVVEARLYGAQARTAMDNQSRGNRSQEKNRSREMQKAGVPTQLPLRGDTPATVDGDPPLLIPEDVGEVTPSTPGMDHVIETHAKGAGVPGKTEWPTSDPEVIARIVHNAINDPSATWQNRGQMVTITSTVTRYPVSVNLTTMNGDRRIWTAYPDESPTTPRNPKEAST